MLAFIVIGADGRSRFTRRQEKKLKYMIFIPGWLRSYTQSPTIASEFFLPLFFAAPVKCVSVCRTETAMATAKDKKETFFPLFFVVYHSLKSFVFVLCSCLRCIMHNKKQFRAASWGKIFVWPMKNYHIFTSRPIQF